MLRIWNLAVLFVRQYRQAHPTRFNVALGLLVAAILSFLFFRTGFVALLLLGTAAAAFIAYLFFFAGPAAQPQAVQPPQANQPLVYDPRTIVPNRRPDIMTPLQWFFATEGAKGPHFGVLAALIVALIPMALFTLLLGWVGLVVGGAFGGLSAAYVWNNGVLVVEPNARVLLTVNEIRVASFEIGESIVWLPRVYPFLFGALLFDMSERSEKMAVRDIETRKGGRVNIGLEFGWRPDVGHLNSFYEFQRSDADGIRKLFEGTTDNAALLFVSSYPEAKDMAVGGTREKLARFVRRFAMKQARGIDPAYTYTTDNPGEMVDDLTNDVPTFRPGIIVTSVNVSDFKLPEVVSGAEEQVEAAKTRTRGLVLNIKTGTDALVGSGIDPNLAGSMAANMNGVDHSAQTFNIPGLTRLADSLGTAAEAFANRLGQGGGQSGKRRRRRHNGSPKPQQPQR